MFLQLDAQMTMKSISKDLHGLRYKSDVLTIGKRATQVPFLRERSTEGNFENAQGEGEKLVGFHVDW